MCIVARRVEEDRGLSGQECTLAQLAFISSVHDICLFQMNKQTLKENCCKLFALTLYCVVRWWWWWRRRWKMIKVSHLNVFLMYACLHATIILLSWLFKRKFTTTPFLVFVLYECVCVTAIIFKVALNCLSRPNNKSALEMLFTIQNTHRDNHSGMSKEHFNLILLRNSLVKQFLNPLLLVELL